MEIRCSETNRTENRTAGSRIVCRLPTGRLTDNVRNPGRFSYPNDASSAANGWQYVQGSYGGNRLRLSLCRALFGVLQ
jgi:hypothetical protein